MVNVFEGYFVLWYSENGQLGHWNEYCCVASDVPTLGW